MFPPGKFREVCLFSLVLAVAICCTNRIEHQEEIQGIRQHIQESILKQKSEQQKRNIRDIEYSGHQEGGAWVKNANYLLDSTKSLFNQLSIAKERLTSDNTPPQSLDSILSSSKNLSTEYQVLEIRNMQLLLLNDLQKSFESMTKNKNFLKAFLAKSNILEEGDIQNLSPPAVHIKEFMLESNPFQVVWNDSVMHFENGKATLPGSLVQNENYISISAWDTTFMSKFIPFREK